MQIPHFITNPVERGNTYITFSWAHCHVARVAFPDRKPFLQELWDAVPRPPEMVILQIKEKHLFEVISQPIWCQNNVLIELAYRGTVELIPQTEYMTKLAGETVYEVNG